jgi:uncharacterized protein YcbK (DUF882 family)
MQTLVSQIYRAFKSASLLVESSREIHDSAHSIMKAINFRIRGMYGGIKCNVRAPARLTTRFP